MSSKYLDVTMFAKPTIRCFNGGPPVSTVSAWSLVASTIPQLDAMLLSYFMFSIRQ